MKHYFSIVAFLLGMLYLQPVFATQIADLYQADVDSTTSGNEWQRQALAQVLVRVSGKAEVTELPQVKAELAKAAGYVKQFENVRQAGGNRMRVLLDAEKVNQLLQQQGIAVWGALRPDTLIWLVEQNGSERQFIRQSSHPVNAAMQQAFRQAALPLTLPLYDMDDLLSGGGMASMLNTIWLIFSAMMFGAVVEHIGLLRKFVQSILAFARSTGSLITSTMATCLATNILTADQYMSIVMPGRMFKEEYQRRNLAPVNLSRTLEDGGTITSPLIPWNTCGAYMHGVLGVSPLEYMFYAFFNVINPVLAIVYAYLGIKILRLTPPEALLPVVDRPKA